MARPNQRQEALSVLPFESLSPEKDNVFLAGGLYDGVSTSLQQNCRPKCHQPQQVGKYRDARNAQEIGRALNVAYVLKGGSVRHEHRDEDCRHDRIHINAELIDTRTGAHVWAQEYDRELCDVMARQGEIAQKVAEGVHVASLRLRTH